MVSINDYLDIILEDFEEYLRSNPCLCHLKDVHYDAGRVPDYTDVHVQQLYLLRYAYAYAFEYKCMYKHMPDYIAGRQDISVMSIGCGNMIDYWALAQVVRSGVSLNYKGFDSVDWAYKFTRREGDRVSLILGDAMDAIEESDDWQADIITFPKSISEFEYDAIDRFSNCIRTKRIHKDRVCVLVSLRADKGSVQRDMIKSQKIYNAFLDAGFVTQSRCDVVSHLRYPDKKIRELDSHFQHPGNVVNLLIELNTKCAEYKESNTNCNTDCVDRLCRWPMLSCRHFQWQLFEFEREVT